MPKKKKAEVNKAELNPNDYSDYGEYMAAKRAAEVAKPKAEAEEVEPEKEEE